MEHTLLLLSRSLIAQQPYLPSVPCRSQPKSRTIPDLAGNRRADLPGHSVPRNSDDFSDGLRPLLRATGHLQFKQLVNALLSRVVGPGVVPLYQNLWRSLSVSRAISNSFSGFSICFSAALAMTDYRFCRFAVKQIRVVLQGSRQVFPVVRKCECQVKLGRSRLHFELFRF